MTQFARARVLVLLLAIWPLAARASGAEPEAAPPAAPAPAPAEGAAPVKPVETVAPAKPALNETQQYCQNIAAAAADARFAWQRKQLNDLETQIKQRITDLQARETAFREVLDHRDEVMKRAADTVVGIYAKMKPEAAAQQLAALDDEVASAILAQLTTKQSSAILTEIPAGRAVKLISAITANAAVGGKKS